MASQRIGPDEGRLLGILGIRESEEQAYRWLLAHPGASAQEVAEGLTFGLRKTQHLLNSLEAIGFTTHSPEHPRRYIPASPDIAVAALARHRREELDHALNIVPELLRHTIRNFGNREQVVELITSREAERHTFEQIVGGAQEEIVTLIRLPMLVSRLDVDPTEDRPFQRKAQARGAHCRSIVDADFLETPGALRTIREDIKAGEEVRTVSHLPFKMVLADHRTAFIPLNLEQPDSPSLLIRSSALLDGLFALFEILWDRAAPIWLVNNNELEIGEGRLSPLGKAEELIPLLAGGLNDKAIVQELGVSRRTLLRRVSELMKYLDARTRFQAGWVAALRLSGTEDEKKPDIIRDKFLSHKRHAQNSHKNPLT